VTMYDLYLESGPRRKKTMVHVIELLGCVATGPTTEAAIEGTPDAIRAFHRFLARHGEAIDHADPIELRVIEHLTEGVFIGNGTPYITYGPDLHAITDEEIGRLLNRVDWLYEEVIAWAERQLPPDLAFKPAGGRANHEVLLHIMGSQASALSISLGSAPGFGKIRGAAERGEMPMAEALSRMGPMVRERIAATTPEQRNAVRVLDTGTFTLRKLLRGTLEHLWDHLTELSLRPGGPLLYGHSLSLHNVPM